MDAVSARAAISDLITQHEDFTALLSECVAGDSSSLARSPLQENTVDGVIEVLENHCRLTGSQLSTLSTTVLASRLRKKFKTTSEDQQQLLLSADTRAELDLLINVYRQVSERHGFCHKLFAKTLNKDVCVPLEVIWRLHSVGMMTLNQYITSNLDRATVISGIAQNIANLCCCPLLNVSPGNEQELLVIEAGREQETGKDFPKKGMKEGVEGREPHRDTRKEIVFGVINHLAELGYGSASDSEKISNSDTDLIRGLKKVAVALLDSITKKLLLVYNTLHATTIGGRSPGEPLSTVDISPYEGLLLVGAKQLDNASLKRYCLRQLTVILTCHATLKASDAVKQQRDWTFSRTPNFLRTIYQQLLVSLEATDAVSLLFSILEQREVNWSFLLSVTSVILVCFTATAEQHIDVSIQDLLRKSLISSNMDGLVAAILLARHACLEASPASQLFGSYQKWFQRLFFTPSLPSSSASATATAAGGVTSGDQISVGGVPSGTAVLVSSVGANLPVADSTATVVVSSKKSFIVLVKFLSDIVPYESSDYLKLCYFSAAVQAVMHQTDDAQLRCEDGCHSEKNRRTRLQYLEWHKERALWTNDSPGALLYYQSFSLGVKVEWAEECVDDESIYSRKRRHSGDGTEVRRTDHADDASNAKGMKLPIELDVETALTSFEKNGKVPSSVMEASIFKKPYFVGKFLPCLLQARLLPEIADSRMKLIESLRKSEKIPESLYNNYVRRCQQEADQLLQGVFDVDVDNVDSNEMLLSDDECLEKILNSYRDAAVLVLLRKQFKHPSHAAGVLTLDVNCERLLSSLNEKISSMLNPHTTSEYNSAHNSLKQPTPLVVDLNQPALHSTANMVAHMLLNCIGQLVHALSQLNTSSSSSSSFSSSSILPRFSLIDWSPINDLLLALRRLAPPVLLSFAASICNSISDISIDPRHLDTLAAIAVHWINCAETSTLISVIGQGSSSTCNIRAFLLDNLLSSTKSTMTLSLRFSTSYAWYSHLAFVDLVVEGDLEHTEGSVKLHKEDDSRRVEKIQENRLGDQDSRMEYECIGEDHTGSKENIHCSDYTNKYRNDSMSFDAKGYAVGIIPLKLVSLITYLGPRIFTRLRGDNTVAISFEPGEQRQDALFTTRLHTLWNQGNTCKLLRGFRISFVEWIMRELSVMKEMRSDNDLDITDLDRYYIWVVYSGHHSTGVENCIETEVNIQGVQAAKRSTGDNKLSSGAVSRVRQYAIELLHGLIDGDVRRPGDVGREEGSGNCLGCKGMRVKHTRVNGAGNQKKLLALLQKLSALLISLDGLDSDTSPHSRSWVWSVLSARHLQLHNQSGTYLDPFHVDVMSFFSILQSLPCSTLLSASAAACDVFQPPQLRSSCGPEHFSDSTVTPMQQLTDRPSRSFLRLREMISAVNDFARNYVTSGRMFLCFDLAAHLLSALSLIPTCTAGNDGELCRLEADNQKNEEVCRLINFCPLLATSAIFHFDSLALLRHGDALSGKDTLARMFWRSITGAVMWAKRFEEKRKQQVSAVEGIDWGEDLTEGSDFAIIPLWLHGFALYSLQMKYYGAWSAPLCSISTTALDANTSVVLLHCHLFEYTATLLRDVSNHTAKNSSRVSDYSYERALNRVLEMWSCDPHLLHLSHVANLGPELRNIVALLASDAIQRLHTVSCLHAFIHGTGSLTSDPYHQSVSVHSLCKIFVHDGRNLSVAMRWYNDCVRLYETLSLPDNTAMDCPSTSNDMVEETNSFAGSDERTTTKTGLNLQQNVLSFAILSKAANALLRFICETDVKQLKLLDTSVIDDTDFNLRVEIKRRLGTVNSNLGSAKR